MIGNKKSVFINTFMLYLLAAAKILFPLITLPFLTRVLSVDTYGAVAYIKSVTAYVQTVIDFGFIYSAVNDIVRLNKKNDLISSTVGNTVLARLLLAIVSILVVFFLSFFIPILKGYPVLLLFSIFPPLFSCFLLDYFFRGIEKMHVVSIVFTTMKTISTLLTILFVKGDQQVLLIPIFDSISSIVAVAITWVIYLKMGYHIKYDGFKAVLNTIKKSFFYFTNSAAGSVLGSLTTIIVGTCINDLQQVAYWSVSIQLIGAVQAMYTPISQGIFPYMVKNKDLKLIRIVFLVFIPIVMIGTGIVGVISPILMTIISGSKYTGAATVFRCLLPVLVISFPVAILGMPTLGSIGKVKQINTATLSGATIQLVGLCLLSALNCFTLYTVAIVRNLSEFIMLIVLVFWVLKYKEAFKCSTNDN